jgi:transcriptional regulator with XRE-family HTH domain
MGKGQLKNDELIKQIVLLIKHLREERDLTQEDVYNDTGIHIARIESARVNVSISTLHTLATYFEMSLEEFFQRIKA